MVINKQLRLPETAQLVRALYIRSMRAWLEKHHGRHQDYGDNGLGRWDGGEDAYSARHTPPVWLRLAAFLDDLEAEPESYLTAAFALATAHPPTPVQLMSAANAEQYGQRHATIVRQMELELLGDLDRAQVAFRQRNAWRPAPAPEIWHKVLRDRSLLITPLTRWVVAGLYQLVDVQELFRAEAAAQRAKAPSLYDRAWAAIMPEAALPLADGAR